MSSTNTQASVAWRPSRQGSRGLRVLFLSTGYPSEVRPSIGTFQRTMAESICGLGADVEIDAPIPFVPPGFSHLAQKWREYAGIPYRYVLNGITVHSPRYMQVPGGDFWSFPHLLIERTSLLNIDRRPDIIHAHCAYPAGLAALGLSEAWGVPAMLTLHGSDVHRYPYVNAMAMRRFQQAVRGAACVTTVSASLAAQTERLCGRRPEVIPIGIGLDRFDDLPTREEARRRLGLPMDRRLALFVGALVPEKGAREFATAFAGGGMDDVTGVVIGAGPLARELRAQRSILTLGMRPNETIPLFMRACDMLVLPSYGEGMPTVLVEAGAAGLPVIASRVGGIPELLEEERGTLLREISADAVREGIRDTIDDPEGAMARSMRLRRYIEAQYDAKKNAAVYIDRYRRSIASTSGSRSALPRRTPTVCILTTAHSPLDSRIYYREALSLATSGGYRVVLIAPDDGTCAQNGKVEVIRIPRHRNRLQRFTMTAMRVVKEALRVNADVYHFHDPDLLPWMSVFAIMGRKVVYDVHEYYGYSLQTVEWLPQSMRRIVAATVDWFEKKNNTLFAGTITVNPHMEGLFRAKGSNTITISNYPLPWFIEETAPDGASTGRSILYLGNINMIRGYKTIFDAMEIIHSSHPELVCNVIGHADYTGIDGSVPRLDGALALERGIRYMPFIPFTDVPEYLKRAGVCWLPWRSTTDHELGTPVKLFEYLASGRPVVCSELGFVAAVVKELGCGILVPPDDPRAHAEALVYILTHDEEAAAMGARGRQGVVERYNWVAEEKKLLGFYRELLAPKGHGR